MLSSEVITSKLANKSKRQVGNLSITQPLICQRQYTIHVLEPVSEHV